MKRRKKYEARRQERRSGTIFSFVLLAILLLPMLVCMFLGLHLSIVTSGSMKPAIDPGDVVLTKYQPAHSIKAGQIILYFNTELGSEVSHRVFSVQPQGNLIAITTKGDANPVADTPVTFNGQMPIPVSKFIIPKIGYLLIKITGGFGRIAFILFGAFVIGNLFIKRRFTKFSNRKSGIEPLLAIPSMNQWMESYPSTRKG